MKRFVEIDDIEGFAFYCTINGKFEEFSGSQSWNSEEDFIQDYEGCELERYTRLISDKYKSMKTIMNLKDGNHNGLYLQYDDVHVILCLNEKREYVILLNKDWARTLVYFINNTMLKDEQPAVLNLDGNLALSVDRKTGNALLTVNEKTVVSLSLDNMQEIHRFLSEVVSNIYFGMPLGFVEAYRIYRETLREDPMYYRHAVDMLAKVIQETYHDKKELLDNQEMSYYRFASHCANDYFKSLTTEID